MDRLANSLSLKPVTENRLRLAQPRSSGTRPKPASASPSMGWLNAVNSQIALKPVTANNLRSLRAADDLQSDSISYQPVKSKDRSRKKFKSNLPGGIKFNYDQIFRKAAKVFRWINETSYGISILFMMLAIIGYILQLSGSSQPDVSTSVGMTQELSNPDAASTSTRSIKLPPQPRHRFIKIGFSGIVILNVVRLIAGLANLIAIPFRKSPTQGILFLIPPYTFIYIRQNWKRMQKPVQRIIGPLFALSVVVAAYMFIPSLGRVRHANGTLQDQVKDAVKSIQGDVNRSVKDARNGARSLQNQLPDQIEKAKQAAKGLQGKAQDFIDKNVPDQIENATKSLDNLKDQFNKAVGNQEESGKDDTTKPQSIPTPETKTNVEPK